MIILQTILLNFSILYKKLRICEKIVLNGKVIEKINDIQAKGDAGNKIGGMGNLIQFSKNWKMHLWCSLLMKDIVHY
jgi:hypothetical protein